MEQRYQVPVQDARLYKINKNVSKQLEPFESLLYMVEEKRSCLNKKTKKKKTLINSMTLVESTRVL